MRLISADDLIDTLERVQSNCDHRAFVFLDELIKVFQSEDVEIIDAEPVRHGHWITEGEADDSNGHLSAYECSECHHCDWDDVDGRYFKYCPNCGAKMDGNINAGKTDG